MMGDLVAVDAVGPAIAGHAAKQRFDLRGGRLRPRGLVAAARPGEHQHAPVGAVVDVADRIGTQKLGLGAGGNFLAYRRDELPGAEEMLARGIIGHVASFNASPRRSKVCLGEKQARRKTASPPRPVVPEPYPVRAETPGSYNSDETPKSPLAPTL